MGDPLDAAAAVGRVEVGVEHAAAARPLQLGAGALADLEAGLAEALAKLAGGEADEHAARPRQRRRGGAGRRLGRAGAGGEERDGGEGKQAAHRLFMAAGRLAGKRPGG